MVPQPPGPSTERNILKFGKIKMGVTKISFFPVCVHVQCMYVQVPSKARRGHQGPRSWRHRLCEPLDVGAGLDSGTLQIQQVLFAEEPSPQTLLMEL